MQKLEKRVSPRQALQIPLHFHLTEIGTTEPELAAETSNISRSGLFMCSPLPLKVGVSLAMTLRVPTYLSGSARSVIKCMGRVVHERRLPNGDIGYGIHFEQMLNFQHTSVCVAAVSNAHEVVNTPT
jgi:hypothetical protein